MIPDCVLKELMVKLSIVVESLEFSGMSEID
jgi:hypothetical protein